MNHLDTKGTEPLQKHDRTVRNEEMRGNIENNSFV